MLFPKRAEYLIDELHNIIHGFDLANFKRDLRFKQTISSIKEPTDAVESGPSRKHEELCQDAGRPRNELFLQSVGSKGHANEATLANPRSTESAK